MSRDDERFIQQAKVELDRSEAEISPYIAERLRQARHEAITSRSRSAWSMWVPAMAATAMLVVAVSVSRFAGMPQPSVPTALPVRQVATDFEMLTHGEDLELFADLDFYLWLEQRGGHAS